MTALATGPAAPAAFATRDDVLGALAHGRDVALSAYVLAPGNAVARALDAAAGRGAAVAVTLEDFESGGPAARGLHGLARRTADDLRAHGARVSLGVPNGDVVHLKAAVVDGTAYLDDRNWAAAGETIVAVRDPERVALVRAAIRGETGCAAGLATEKAGALELEAEAIRSGGDRIDLETESFGSCAVERALRERAESGATVRLLVSGRVAFAKGSERERAVLHRLAAAGVAIRTTDANEKLCVAGDAGWVGSANATYDAVPTTDWGLRVREPPLLAALETSFASEWRSARPFA
jgi:phosphatidylserine/phosphatidylglycerophosphate/cardiolipin synthase-like enzyme